MDGRRSDLSRLLLHYLDFVHIQAVGGIFRWNRTHSFWTWVFIQSVGASDSVGGVSEGSTGSSGAVDPLPTSFSDKRRFLP